MKISPSLSSKLKAVVFSTMALSCTADASSSVATNLEAPVSHINTYKINLNEVSSEVKHVGNYIRWKFLGPKAADKEDKRRVIGQLMKECYAEINWLDADKISVAGEFLINKYKEVSISIDKKNEVIGYWLVTTGWIQKRYDEKRNEIDESFLDQWKHRSDTKHITSREPTYTQALSVTTVSETNSSQIAKTISASWAVSVSNSFSDKMSQNTWTSIDNLFVETIELRNSSFVTKKWLEDVFNDKSWVRNIFMISFPGCWPCKRVSEQFNLKNPWNHRLVTVNINEPESMSYFERKMNIRIPKSSSVPLWFIWKQWSQLKWADLLKYINH